METSSSIAPTAIKTEKKLVTMTTIPDQASTSKEEEYQEDCGDSDRVPSFVELSFGALLGVLGMFLFKNIW